MTDETPSTQPPQTAPPSAPQPAPPPAPPPARRFRISLSWLDAALILVLLAGAYLRFTGLDWGEYQYLHPDERFLVWVGTDISPKMDVETAGGSITRRWLTVGEYFDTVNSPLNPNNRGHGFYVYGTLPMFLTRFVVELIYGHSGFAEMTDVGRAFSATADLLLVLLVYLVAERVYGKKVALLASAFSAFSVLQIQQSHFFTMDTFLTFFTLLALYFAVRVLTDPRIWPREDRALHYYPAESEPPRPPRKGLHPLLLPSIGFGIALGLAVASKLNAAPVAAALPAALLLRMLALPPRERDRRLVEAFGYLVLAAVVSIVIFRLFQPYAFSGPGLLGVRPNPAWVNQIREQRSQANADADFPPAMQWARRPVWFSGLNLVVWGLGLPLGLLAWAGFLWAGWRMLSASNRWAEVQRHGLLWGWTGAYFAWQSLALNPTMRYQLLIYPTLCIFAAWAVVALYERGRRARPWERQPLRGRTLRGLAITLGIGVLAATAVYAFAFAQIYTRPITRIAATRWIYQNIPGPINLRIQTGEGVVNQPIPFPYTFSIAPGLPYQYGFTPRQSGLLSEVYLPEVKDLQAQNEARTLTLSIVNQADSTQPLTTATLTANLSPGGPQTFKLNPPVALDESQSYTLTLNMQGQQTALLLQGVLGIQVQTSDGGLQETNVAVPAFTLRPNLPFGTDYVPLATGLVAAIRLPAAPQPGEAIPQRVSLAYNRPGEPPENLYSDLLPTEAGEGGYLLLLDNPLPVIQGENHFLSLELPPVGGQVTLAGAGIANEGDWDDGLPLRMDGYDGFGGIYKLDLNFNMYPDDSPDKLQRFTRILGEADYLLITSSRQWGSLPRIPERFPMTTVYYRNLLGCPEGQSIEWCYNVAQPGRFQGRLGYELVETFDSSPRIGPVVLNDQFAEEAFTVYDHPKVFIFQKTADYDPQRVQAILGAVDFNLVVRVPPMRLESHPADLLLPEERQAEQQQGGTWSQLFDTQAPVNRWPALGVALWYGTFLLLGLLAYPLLRLALPGLADRGYPLARIAGLLMLALLVWLAGSARIPFTRLTISLCLLVLFAASALAAFRNRAALSQELRERGGYFLVIEGLFLAFFLLDLAIRIGNPDLWHPWKGGEKPMDFAYFNAVLRSTSFPPYDPWFAGGYLNYYYYGFVLMGVVVKWLGIVPAVAYNLILPTVFSLIAMGAFSLAWNISSGRRASHFLTGAAPPLEPGIAPEAAPLDAPEPEKTEPGLRRFWAALGAALGMALLGNLGTVRMIFQGYERLAAPGGVLEGANIVQRWIWAVQGFWRAVGGANLPYGLGDWYWIPSRAIPAPGDIEPITEFPFFTVIYADPHAHLYSMPVALLALGFALSVVLSGGRWQSWRSALLGFFVGGLAIGALRPTNTWDFYTYLAIGVVAVVYGLWQSPCLPERMAARLPFLADFPHWARRSLAAAAGAALLVGLCFFLYQPYSQWFAQAYTQARLWTGTHTPISAYLTHWGLFLFVIVSWMAWETRDWMANTPATALRRLEKHEALIGAALALLLLILAILLYLGVVIAWLALPLAAWSLVLILRPGQSDARRFVLFLVGTGLFLTMMVEVVVLVGDIGRMNTVFKFYLQVWTLFAVSAGAALFWLLRSMRAWLPGWRSGWLFALAVLVAGAALFPLLGSMAKIKDRMAAGAPQTLDGMSYMAHAVYGEEWGEMDLAQDYRAIRWMQENVQGSPVIVEGNMRNLYRWGSRYSIYTGLPSVVGWEWHQQQQRAAAPAHWVSSRIAEVDQFYQTNDLEEVQVFLRKYDVRYIIVGQLERGHYGGIGLDKFAAQEGVLWVEVYRDADTVIYAVRDI